MSSKRKFVVDDNKEGQVLFCGGLKNTLHSSMYIGQNSNGCFLEYWFD